jgi:hypothetical protein
MSRSVPARATYTFANGATVALERVGPLFALPIQRANPPPPPPLAPGVGGALEPNPADPDYAKTLEAHQQRIAFLIQDALLDLGVADDLPIDAAAVARVRSVYARSGVELAESDKLVYLKYVCIGSQDELERLFKAIRSYDVSEEAIGVAGEMFPDHGDGAAAGGGAGDPAEVAAAL